MGEIKATIIVPTTGDRGPLLPLSIGSILNQTVKEIEVFVMGDGVNESTRQTILQLKKSDPRIKFFDHPKHPRRGETYRHEALKGAQGQIICYLCDRDLMLPNHVETLLNVLDKYNFVSNLVISVSQNNSFELRVRSGYLGEPSNQNRKRPSFWDLPLSSVGHTKDLYNELPYGWRTTPIGLFTDQYMWQQFLASPKTKSYSNCEPTILYFKRGDHPGLSAEERLLELTYWSEQINHKLSLEKIHRQMLEAIFKDNLLLKRKLHSLRYIFRHFFWLFFRKLYKLLKRLSTRLQ